jgi:polyisoprenyl-teichoic acid--peptidoglycan teichoic acid transferase
MPNNKREKDDYSSIEIPDFVNHDKGDDEEDFLKDINSSLAEQVSSYQDIPSSGKKGKKKKKSPFLKVSLALLLILLVVGGLLMFTESGNKFVVNMAGKYIYSNLKYQPSKEVNAENDDDDGKGSGVVVGPVVNILLVGVEEFGGAQNTDSMMIATMNTEDNTLKLTSLMRDLYVDIPGYSKNRLNSAFARGGIDLLYQTIELNFDVKLDGYCMVGFDAFQKIVDLVGGVEVTLTSGEAKYLNSTNYISEKANRNVVAGKQTLNGNQALGYCRVRKVSTGTENNDFGRTQRQRIVMEAIYDKLKSKNVVSLVLLMNDILNQVEIKTDIKEKAFNAYLNEAVGLRANKIETLRIPSDGSYDNIKVKMGKYNQDVLQPRDWDATRKELHTFIYGQTTPSTP